MTSSVDASLAAVQAYATNLSQTIALARALVAAGRAIDLDGLDAQVGLLCAKALDLPPANGELIRADLTNLLGEVDALTGALTQAAEALVER
jgi:hypothetical protein